MIRAVMQWPHAMRIVAQCAGGLILALVCTGVARGVALRLAFVDRPNSITGNRRAGAALGGGIAVIFAIVISLLLLAAPSTAGTRIILSIVPASLFGLLDDIWRFRPPVKVTGQCLSAAIYVTLAGGSALSILFGGLLLLATQNAWNLVDVMDGLLSWIGMTCFVGVFLVLSVHGVPIEGVPSAAIIATGALAGFFIWNRYPAKMLLGDAGSLPLGMLYGMLVLEGVRIDGRLGALLLLPGLTPFFETGFLIVQRWKKGIPFYRASPDHFALRLRQHGHSIPAILRSVTLMGIVLSLAAGLIAIGSFHWVIVGFVHLLLLLGLVSMYRYFDRLSVKETVE